MTRAPRVGVIGTGRWGRHLVRNFAARGALAALCDHEPAVLEGLAPHYPGTALHGSAPALLADPGVEAIAIATPSSTHAELARLALEAGKAVFVEKPLCMSLADGVALAELAHGRARVLMVGHLLLYHPAFEALCAFVASGALGGLRYVYSHRLNFRTARGDGNALWDFAPHDVSMILRLVGGPVVEVTSSGASAAHPEVTDTTLSHITFSCGLQAHLFVSWAHPIKDQRLVVAGERGTIMFDDVLPGSKKLLFYPHALEWVEGAPVLNREEAVPIAYEPGEPLARECDHFLDCVAGGATPRSDACEALRVMAVLDACQRSLDSGRTARVVDPPEARAAPAASARRAGP